MNGSSQRVCAWSGIAFIVLFCAGWLIAGFLPPPDPAASPEEIAEIFRHGATRIRVGMFVCIFGAALLLPWGGAIVSQMRRVEGPTGPLAQAWVIGQACLTIEFIYPCMFWAVAAFRPEDGAERFQRFDDLGWLPFLGITSTAVFQAFALGYLALSDKRGKPVFPRWFGYFVIWAAILFAPASFVIFFKNGPLAWNGIVAWWIAIVAALAFFTATAVTVIRAVNRQAREFVDEDVNTRLSRLERSLSELALRPSPGGESAASPVQHDS